MMELSNGYKIHLLALSILFAIAACMTFFLHGNPIGWGRCSLDVLRSSATENAQVDLATSRLDHILRNASMDNRTVIITTINEAWTKPNSIFDLFLESFRIGEETPPLLNHLVVLAVDHEAMNRCESLNLHCYLLTVDGVDSLGSEKKFMSKEYFKWMWARTRLLGKVLELGYSFVLTDVDILWFKAPFSHFPPDDDFMIACDYFTGNTTDLDNLGNGGYIYARSNNRSISFYKHWLEAMIRFPGKNEQEVFEGIKEGEFVRNLGLKMSYLDTDVFGGFCQHGADLNKLCTLHANCCTKISNKIYDLTMILNIWRRFTSLPEDLKARGIYWKAPIKCRFPF